MSATITCTLCGYHGPKHDVFGQECMRATTERIYRLTEERDAAEEEARLQAAHILAQTVKEIDLEAAVAAKDDALKRCWDWAAYPTKYLSEYEEATAQIITIARNALGATQKPDVKDWVAGWRPRAGRGGATQE